MAVAVAVVLVGLITVGYLGIRLRARDVTPGSPDHVTDDVVSGLMTELRKWQAEAAHWKATAERLQREIDGR